MFLLFRRLNLSWNLGVNDSSFRFLRWRLRTIVWTIPILTEKLLQLVLPFRIIFIILCHSTFVVRYFVDLHVLYNYFIFIIRFIRLSSWVFSLIRNVRHACCGGILVIEHHIFMDAPLYTIIIDPIHELFALVHQLR